MAVTDQGTVYMILTSIDKASTTKYTVTEDVGTALTAAESFKTTTQQTTITDTVIGTQSTVTSTKKVVFTSDIGLTTTQAPRSSTSTLKETTTVIATTTQSPSTVTLKSTLTITVLSTVTKGTTSTIPAVTSGGRNSDRHQPQDNGNQNRPYRFLGASSLFDGLFNGQARHSYHNCEDDNIEAYPFSYSYFPVHEHQDDNDKGYGHAGGDSD
ncbi:hypothetical protein Asppvi_009954 [Aspergillus pseudoviridinutans]|uniref:Uncharacterized protein n=1 Tax=Aspergillus pseudoviridinutans TaxID=1517512 RepID=A0A9P3BNI5_9EURO|nr:uncharacterized protein Asppvi_009954 [Aspergillus pseudoviridinutans]GIJ90989.1 hypothetical protein Asppvi_009954 [Aspergillus pseudoviridinutans]